MALRTREEIGESKWLKPKNRSSFTTKRKKEKKKYEKKRLTEEKNREKAGSLLLQGVWGRTHFKRQLEGRRRGRDTISKKKKDTNFKEHA